MLYGLQTSQILRHLQFVIAVPGTLVTLFNTALSYMTLINTLLVVFIRSQKPKGAVVY